MSGRRWLLTRALPGVAVAVVVGIVLWATGQWARSRALRELTVQTQTAARLSLAALDHKLDKFHVIPRVLAQDTALIATLEAPTAQGRDRLNRRLAILAAELGADTLYVMRPNGRTFAASNWRQADSFVGHDYGFRPYYQDAMAKGGASQFALGTVSHLPGLYLAQRVDGQSGPLGVVVLKLSFRDLESVWARGGMPQFVTDARRVVLFGYPSDWHFRVGRALSSVDMARVRGSLQFGTAPLGPLPLRPPLGTDVEQTWPLVRLTQAAAGLAKGTRLLRIDLAVPQMPGWRLHVLRPVSTDVRQAMLGAQAAGLLGTLLIGLIAWGAVRRRRRAARLRVARQALEAEVALRTRELRDSNARLEASMRERERTEARVHEMQDELVQANRLSLLGQVAANVAHEINQPVGAIRTYADNTREFLRSGRHDRAQDNLVSIARLTERIGGITQELRTFSRKRPAHIEAISLDDALAGALMLVAPRLERQGVALHDTRVGPSPWVLADSLRLEQVFVNLLHNALEALAGRPASWIRLSVTADVGEARVVIADNGPGIAQTVRARLFTPFYTTRAQGVGLGLVISRDIMAEFGGGLTSLDVDEGAAFEVTLKRKEEPK